MRQLLYDFRAWRALEATGRTGSDDGFDARGIEQVGPPDVANLETEDGADETVPDYSTDRVWLIQCKRERRIGPKQLLGYLDSIPPERRTDLYGLIFVASSDFSITARDAFRARARELGMAEAYLWGRAEIEDQLFQPKNDHLLFAYFGISLQIRRRSLRTEVRGRLAMKRKAKRLLRQHGVVLVRDASDERYPWLDDGEGKSRTDRGRWRVFRFQGCRSDGLHFVHRRHFAFIDPDGEHWDFAETMNDGPVTGTEDPWSTEDDRDWQSRSEAMGVWDTLPEETKGWFELFSVLPYERIIEIDAEGDEYCSNPHIYVDECGPDGPFLKHFAVELRTNGGWGARSASPNDALRVEKFPRKAP